MGRFLLPSWVQIGNPFWPRPWRRTSTFSECIADLNWIQGAKFTQRWQKHKGNSSFTDYSCILKRATLLKEIPYTTRRYIPFSLGPLISCHCPKMFIQASKCGWMCVCVCEWMMCPVMDCWPFHRLSLPLYFDFWDKVLHKGWMDRWTDREMVLDTDILKHTIYQEMLFFHTAGRIISVNLSPTLLTFL